VAETQGKQFNLTPQADGLLYTGNEGDFSPGAVAGFWSHAHVRSGEGTDFVIANGNFGDKVVDTLVNRATPGTNDFVTAPLGVDASDHRPAYDPGSRSLSGYVAPHTMLMLDTYRNGNPAYGQFMQQPTPMNATGEFYLLCAFFNGRDGGNRYMWGQTQQDYVRFRQEGNGNYDFSINIAGGGEQVICPSNIITRFNPYIVEVWRDSQNEIFCRINAGAANNLVSYSGTFAMNGFGGGGWATSPAWDDYMLEMLSYSQLPSVEERTQLVDWLNDIWAVF
jgi:hypothetical protein